MWKIFRVDGPLFKILSVLTDLLVANVLFVICSIPLVTMGAAFAGLQRVCMDKAMEDEHTVVEPFFKAFKENFKQSTFTYIIYVLANIALLWYLSFVPQIMTGLQLSIVNAVAIILLVIVNGVWCYMLPIMVRYDNSLKEHFKNSLILTLANLPKTILMVIVTLIPLAMVLLSVDFFVNTFIFWILIGIALLRLCCCVIIKPIIKGFDPTEETEDYEE